jgi:hypothetical protein
VLIGSRYAVQTPCLRLIQQFFATYPAAGICSRDCVNPPQLAHLRSGLTGWLQDREQRRDG